MAGKAAISTLYSNPIVVYVSQKWYYLQIMARPDKEATFEFPIAHPDGTLTYFGDWPEEFLEFAQQVRLAYPDIYRNSLLREAILYFTGGYLLAGRFSELRGSLKEKLSGLVRSKPSTSSLDEVTPAFK